MAKDPFEQFAMPGEMRAFAERGVAQARQAFEGFVEAATKAPSGGNFQPTRWLIVSDAEKRRRLGEIYRGVALGPSPSALSSRARPSSG